MMDKHQIVGPNWDWECHPEITLEQLLMIEEIIVICEAERKDTDGEHYFVFTVGGLFNGQPIVAVDHIRKCVHGATVEGDVIIIHAKDRKEAEVMAYEGLLDTMTLLRQEQLARGTLRPGANAGTIVETEAPRVLLQ